MANEIDVVATLKELKGQQDVLASKFKTSKVAFQKAQVALNESKVVLTVFNDKYSRVLTLIEE